MRWVSEGDPAADDDSWGEILHGADDPRGIMWDQPI